jgi:dUTP pyrophosphatase
MDQQTVRVRVRRLLQSRGLPLPRRASPGSSGLDLLACVDDDVWLEPGASGLIPTGLCLDIPPGYEAQVRPRSGLALKKSITVLNSPGTIDSDYRGEVGVILVNHGAAPFRVRRGDRIAQMVFAAVCHPVLEEADNLGGSDRGDGGFGHSGV